MERDIFPSYCLTIFNSPDPVAENVIENPFAKVPKHLVIRLGSRRRDQNRIFRLGTVDGRPDNVVPWYYESTIGILPPVDFLIELFDLEWAKNVTFGFTYGLLSGITDKPGDAV